MKKKGYTLIELLATIVVLSIVFSIIIYGYSSYIKESKEKIKENEISELINAGSMYYREFENTSQYISYTDEDNVTHSCISVQSLIDMGYYKGNVSFLNEKLTKDNTVIKVKKINGVANYELITNYTKDKDCIYYDFSNELDNNTEIIINNNDNDSDISLITNIINNPNDKNSYILKLKFSADVYEKIANYKVPLYVLIVLDRSGSMKGPKYENARTASISLSKNLIGEFNDYSYIELINFSTDVSVKRSFSNNALEEKDFDLAKDGWTNILDALHLAKTEIDKITPNENLEPIKYVILLTDGKPETSSSSKTPAEDKRCDVDSIDDKRILIDEKSCYDALKKNAKDIKDTNTNLVVIGYNIKEELEDLYKTIASTDTTGTICPESNYVDNEGTKYCYYSSDSDNISNLFNNISNSIEKTVKSQSISKSTINIEFDESIKIYDLNGNEINNLNIDINFDDDKKEILNKEYEYLISVDKLDDEAFDCNYEEKECVYKSELFKKYYIDLYDMNENKQNELTMTNYPTITINKRLKSYIN